MRQLTIIAIVLLAGTILTSCCMSKKSSANKESTQVSVTGPKVMIYKTKKDFSRLVPVELSADKKTLVSYPDVKDVYFNGSLAYPTQLAEGYWLDNRGISIHTAFISLSYDEYSKLSSTPLPDEIMKLVIDTEPFNKIYSCGLRSSYTDIVNDLNTKITSGDFSAFTKIK